MGANLVEADLRNAMLDGADLYEADLRYIKGIDLLSSQADQVLGTSISRCDSGLWCFNTDSSVTHTVVPHPRESVLLITTPGVVPNPPSTVPSTAHTASRRASAPCCPNPYPGAAKLLRQAPASTDFTEH